MPKKFSETGVGKFLAGVAPAAVDALGEVFPPVKVLKELFGDKIPPEKLQEFETQLRAYEMQELQAYLADVQDARRANVDIQQAAEASWLAKNIGYVLDIMIISAAILLALLLYFAEIPAQNREIAYSLLGILFSLAVQVVSFHRGSSKGSAEKQATLDKILNTR